jgi:hypothetical protein
MNTESRQHDQVNEGAAAAARGGGVQVNKDKMHNEKYK